MLEQSDEEYVFFTQHSYHCNAIGRKCVEKIGYFDENYYPAYFEDADYDYRMNIGGVNWKQVHQIPAECQQDGAATIDGLRPNITALEEYFVAKWNGTPNDHNKFLKPFGDKPVDYWEEKSIEELKRKYGI